MPWAVIKGKLIATIKTDERNLVIHFPLRAPERKDYGVEYIDF